MTRGRVVLLTLAGSAAILASGALVWATGTEQDVAGATVTSVTGRQVVTGLVPFGLAAGAGGLALTLVDGWLRRLVSAVVTLCGLAAGSASVQALLGAATPTVAGVGGEPATTLTEVSTTPAGPAAALVGALLVIAGGLLALARGDRWPRRAARPAAGPRTEPRRSEWDRLSDGEDPT